MAHIYGAVFGVRIGAKESVRGAMGCGVKAGWVVGAGMVGEASCSGRQQVAPVRTAEQMQEEVRLQAKQREEAAIERERQAEAERQRKGEKMDMESIRGEALMTTDDVWRK